MSDNENIWGWELIINCAACSKLCIISENNIRAFLKELVEKIHMKAYGQPMVAHFATHDPEKGGYSFCQMIETSAITGHLVDKNGAAFINIFSCMPFDEFVAIEIVKDYFEPKTIHIEKIIRYSPVLGNGNAYNE